jgi:tetratricopeptide (TPR) repeat protein
MKKILVISFLALMLLASWGCKKKTPDEAMKKAVEKIQKKDLIGARIDLKEILKKYPDHPTSADARFLLAQCYYEERNFEQSRNQFAILFKENGPSSRIGQRSLELILNTYSMEKKYSEAIKEAEKVIENLPEDDNFRFKLSLLVTDLMAVDNNTTGAINLLKKYMDNGKDAMQKSGALKRIVNLYDQNGQYDKVIEAYTSFAEKNPDIDDKNDLTVALAYYNRKSGNKEKADELFAKSVATYEDLIEKSLDNNQKADFLFRMAKTYEIWKNYDKARDSYDIIIKEHPDIPLCNQAIISKGDAFFQEDKFAEALDFFQGILDKNPTDPQMIQVLRVRVAGLMQRIQASSGTLQMKVPQLKEQGK